jgi:hypothetical protein
VTALAFWAQIQCNLCSIRLACNSCHALAPRVLRRRMALSLQHQQPLPAPHGLRVQRCALGGSRDRHQRSALHHPRSRRNRPPCSIPRVFRHAGQSAHIYRRLRARHVCWCFVPVYHNAAQAVVRALQQRDVGQAVIAVSGVFRHVITSALTGLSRHQPHAAAGMATGSCVASVTTNHRRLQMPCTNARARRKFCAIDMGRMFLRELLRLNVRSVRPRQAAPSLPNCFPYRRSGKNQIESPQ